MVVAVCLEIPVPEDPLRIFVPQFGFLGPARKSLNDIPDPSYYIMRLQDVAALALAPLRRFLEMLEVILALQACVYAVAESIFPPSPKPIYNCLKDLVKTIARLASLFPPLAYIRTILDLLNFAIHVVDEIFLTLELLDQRITQLKNTLADALVLGDLELAHMTDCAGQETDALIINLMDILKNITPLITVIVTPIARLMPIPEVRKLLLEMADIPNTLQTIEDSIRSTTVGLPALDSLLAAMSVLRNVCVQIYNIMAPFVGNTGSAGQQTEVQAGQVEGFPPRDPADPPNLVNF